MSPVGLTWSPPWRYVTDRRSVCNAQDPKLRPNTDASSRPPVSCLPARATTGPRLKPSSSRPGFPRAPSTITSPPRKKCSTRSPTHDGGRHGHRSVPRSADRTSGGAVVRLNRFLGASQNLEPGALRLCGEEVLAVLLPRREHADAAKDRGAGHRADRADARRDHPAGRRRKGSSTRRTRWNDRSLDAAARLGDEGGQRADAAAVGRCRRRRSSLLQTAGGAAVAMLERMLGARPGSIERLRVRGFHAIAEPRARRRGCDREIGDGMNRRLSALCPRRFCCGPIARTAAAQPLSVPGTGFERGLSFNDQRTPRRQASACGTFPRCHSKAARRKADWSTARSVDQRLRVGGIARTGRISTRRRRLKPYRVWGEVQDITIRGAGRAAEDQFRLGDSCFGR